MIAARRLYPVAALLACAACTRTPRPSEDQVDRGPQAGAAAPATAPTGALPAGHPAIAGHPQPPTAPAAMPPVAAAPSAASATPTSGAPTSGAPASNRAAAGGLTWRADLPLQSRPPQSSMRAAEYGIMGADPDASLAVFYFGPGQGGSVQDNIDRWMHQFTQPDGRDNQQVALRSTRTVHGINITMIDLTGTFGGGAPGMMPGADTPQPRANYRVVGAVAEGPNGLVFFKMLGPAPDLDVAKGAFSDLLDSIEVGNGG